MAPVPAGQPGLRASGAAAGPRAPRRRRLTDGLLALFAALAAVGLADRAGVTGPGSVRETVLVTGVATAVLSICGVATVRAALPASLRGHELLWIPATGACVLALALGALGYAAVPYEVALVAVLLGAAVAAVVVVRRSGPPVRADMRAIAWPLLLAALGVAVAMVPILRAGFLTVIGNGSDAHLAVGTAQFLQAGHHPFSVAPQEALDQIFPLWRSKTPIYYAFAAVASVTGLEPFEVIAGLSAVLMALAGLGFYLLARERLGAGVGAASAALVLVLLDRSVLHTAMHPYFNQTWGFMALPYVLVLARPAVVEDGRGAKVLLGLFTVVLALAYPLALPIALTGLAATVVHERRRRGLAWRPRKVVRRGLRRAYAGPRSLLWMVPAALVASVPAFGVLEKTMSALQVVGPGSDLSGWGGDLAGFFPWQLFVSAGSDGGMVLIVPALVVGCVVALRHVPADVRMGLGAVLAFGVLFALWFRARDGGWYFHFKVLAFTAPLAVTCAAVGLVRLRTAGVVVVALWIGSARLGAEQELLLTYDQVPRSVLEVRDVLPRVSAGESVRLDMPGNEQLWVANLLADRRLCAQRPLLGTSYPHVQTSRRADWILKHLGQAAPTDAAPGPPVPIGRNWVLYRQAAATPGRDRCSQRMVQTVTDPTS